MTQIAEGNAARNRCLARTVRDYLAEDAITAPDVVRSKSPIPLGAANLPVERYLSREFHDLEVERVWRRVWQMACREEDIPQTGDYIVYDIADSSIIVLRNQAGDIKAFHNSCLHRGAKLRDVNGTMPVIRCPFHGFTWTLSGDLLDVPCHVVAAPPSVRTRRASTVQAPTRAGRAEPLRARVPEGLKRARAGQRAASARG